MDFFILWHDMKRNRTTRPVISQIASEWPAVSDGSDWWDREDSQTHSVRKTADRHKLLVILE